MNHFVRVILIVLLFLGGCAKQGYPPGGPVDKTGPFIIESYPQPEAVGVSPHVSPWIRLNEWLDRNSVENAVFISPEPEGGFEIKIRGKKIRVRFAEPLPENRTTVITFGAGIRDVNGNQMASSFVLAFSTGQRIEKNEIRGEVAGMTDPGAVWVWAYPLESFSEPDPRRDKAPFATQPDLDGGFLLPFLPEGNYRLFAVEEERRDRLWDSEKETIAFPPEDVKTAPGVFPYVNLRLSVCDLQAPSLENAEALHRQAVRLAFDEPVRVDSMVVDARREDGAELSVIGVCQDPSDSSAVLLTTAIQRKGDVYRFALTEIEDFTGNRADSISADVAAATFPDTVGPRFTWTDPEDGAQDVALDVRIRVGFSEPITLTDLPGAISLHRTDGDTIAGRWRYPASNLGVFEPETGLQTDAEYTLTIIGARLRDIFGNPSPDSLIAVSFRTLDPEETGGISGEVGNAVPDLRVVAEYSGSLDRSFQTDVDRSGAFRLGFLPAGFYRLWLYRDFDDSGTLSPGRLSPFTYAEPFCSGVDSIRVRSRWETERVTLTWMEIYSVFDNPSVPINKK
jgi:hypothetical protein